VSETPVRRRVVASGRVQGVFFRDSTRREAERRGDGAVEVVFEGPQDAVAAMVDFVRAGPGHSDVRDVDVEPEEPEGLQGFVVR
jgi:acylphosphatase